METWKRGVIIGAAVLVLLGAAAAGVSYWSHYGKIGLLDVADPSDAQIAQMVDLLGYADVHVVVRARARLLALADRAVPALGQKAADQGASLSLRMSATQVLIELDAEAACKALNRIAADPDLETRRVVLTLMIRLQHPCVGDLAVRLAEDPDEDIVVGAANILDNPQVQVTDPQAAAQVLQRVAASTRNPRVKRHASQAAARR